VDEGVEGIEVKGDNTIDGGRESRERRTMREDGMWMRELREEG